MDRDTQDILGQPTLPRMEGFDHPSSSFSPLRALLTLIVLGGLWAAALSLRRMYQENREKSLKLATRRRLGIPDTDRRPFNVAYAAAVLAKEDREKNERSKPRRHVPERPQQPTPQADSQTLRNRSDRYRSATTMPFPGAYTSSSYSSFGSPSHQVPQEPQTNGHQPGTSRHAARRIVDLSSEVEPRKRGHDDSDLDLLSDPEASRKSRRLGGDDDDELMDEDDDVSDVPEEAEWDDYETALSHQRPMKRGLLGDAGEQGRDKRARKVSLVPEDMEVDVDAEEGQDELRDLRSPVRGKKRDRAEAGSTFGGDDDDDDGSVAEDERVRRSRRKRRTVWKRKSDGGIGSRKRDRDMDVDDDLDSSGGPDASSQRKHKKGKRHSRANGDDISVNDSITSSASKSRRGRKSGEEWESNGVRYKLGPDGERLQQALVKRARHKFVMPKDSEHPDKDENLEVFVETWLTDAEYTKAKDQKLLAWQDTPKKPDLPENLSLKIPPSNGTTTATKPSAHVGKNLLWTSAATVTPGASPASISPLDSPSLRGSGLRTPGRGRYSLGMNPFEKQPDISTKRIVSASIMNGSLSGSVTPVGNGTAPGGGGGAGGAGGRGGLTDSTNVVIARPRTLSKWERQELEAEAIMRLRAARQAELDAAARERAEKEGREREVRERVERERQERERQERERQERAERERQERERREREERERREREAAHQQQQQQAQQQAQAQAVVVPKITVTTPSTEGIKPTGAGGFSFAPPPAAAPAPAGTVEKKVPTGAALASTFFGPPSTSSSSTPAASTTNAGSSIFGPPKTEGVAAGGGGFSFPKPTAPSTTAPAAAGGFSFGVPAKPEEKKPEPPKPSGFAFPSTSSSSSTAGGAFGPAATTSSGIQTGATAKPKFDFGVGGSKSVGDEGKPAGGFNAFSKPAGDAPVGGGGIKFSFSGNPSTGTTTTTNGAAGTSAFGQTNGTAGSVFGQTNKPSVFGQPSGASALGGALGGSSQTGNAGSAFAFGGDKEKGKAPVAGTGTSGFGTFGAPTSLASVPSSRGNVFGGGVKTESVFGGAGGGGESSGKSTFSFAPATTTTPKAPPTFGGFNTQPNGAGTTGTTTTPGGAPPATGFSFNFAGGAGGAGAGVPKPAPAAGAFSFGAPAGGANAFGGTGTTTPAGAPGFSFGGKK